MKIVVNGVGGQASAALIDDSELTVYAGAPHGISDTRKEQLGDDLLAFLNSSRGVPQFVVSSTRKDDA